MAGERRADPSCGSYPVMDDSASSLSEISRKETLFGPVFETDLRLSLDWPYTVGTQHAEQTICWCAPNPNHGTDIICFLSAVPRSEGGGRGCGGGDGCALFL